MGGWAAAVCARCGAWLRSGAPARRVRVVVAAEAARRAAVHALRCSGRGGDLDLVGRRREVIVRRWGCRRAGVVAIAVEGGINFDAG